MGRLNCIDPNPEGQDIINHEDLSIFVELVTTKKDRAAINRDDENKLTEFNKGETKIPIKFLKGSDAGDGKTQLTTHYTEVNTKFNEANPDLETLGITSIDIDFNTSYTPMIKINFTDVRGKLFEMGENSPYNVFFNMPYPIFELTVKGYFGKAVKYCLHLTKFTGKLNDKTGNFEIQCDFVGYTYAFLADMLMGYLRGISETQIAEKHIEQAKVKFASYDPPQAFFGMNEFNEKVKSLASEIDKLKNTDERIQQLAKIEDGVTKIDSYKATINTFLKNLGNEKDTSNKSHSLLYRSGMIIYRRPTEDVSERNITNAIDNDYNKLFVEGKIRGFNTDYGGQYEIKENILKIQEGVNGNYGIRKIDFIYGDDYETYVDNEGEVVSGETRTYTLKTVPSIENKGDEDNYFEHFRDDILLLGNKVGEGTEMGYIDLREAIEHLSDIGDRLVSDGKTTKELLANELIEKIEAIFQVETLDADGNRVTIKFSPTIRNMVRILTEHVHIFMKCIKEVAGTVKEDIASGRRKDQFKKLSTDRIYELQAGADATGQDNTAEINEVLPFPDYKEKNTDRGTGGYGAYEDKWIGGATDGMPEVDFIEDLLEGLINAKKKDNELLEALQYGEDEWYPINPFDTKIMTGYVNPWKGFAKVNSQDEIIRHMLIRATIAIGYSHHAGTSESTGFALNEVKAIARLEANNAFNNIETEAVRHGLRFYDGASDANSLASKILSKAGYPSGGNEFFRNAAENLNNDKIFGKYTYESVTSAGLLDAAFDLTMLATQPVIGITSMVTNGLPEVYEKTELVEYIYIPAVSTTTNTLHIPHYLPLSSPDQNKNFYTGNELITKDGEPASVLEPNNWVTNSDRIALREEGKIFFSSYLGGNTKAGLAKPDDGASTVAIIRTADYNPAQQNRYPEYSESITESIDPNGLGNICDLTNVTDMFENFSQYSNIFGGPWKTHEFVDVKLPEGYNVGTNEYTKAWVMFYSDTTDSRPCIGASRTVSKDTYSYKPSPYDIRKGSDGKILNMKPCSGMNEQTNLTENYFNYTNWGNTKLAMHNYKNRIDLGKFACPYLGFDIYKIGANQTEATFTKFSTSLYPTFGTDLYYEQEDDFAKSFLFLHSIPWDGLSYDAAGSWWGKWGNSWESLFPYFDKVGAPGEEVDTAQQAARGTGLFTKTAHLFFTQRAGFIEAPYPWILFVGALLHRFQSSSDIIKWRSGGSQDYALIPHGEGAEPPKKSEYLLPNVATNEIMGFGVNQDNLDLLTTDVLSLITGALQSSDTRVYVALERTLTRLPQSVKNVFKNEYIAWVNDGGFRKIANELEIFTPEATRDQRHEMWLLLNTNLENNADTYLKAQIQAGVLNPKILENYAVLSSDHKWAQLRLLSRDVALADIVAYKSAALQPTTAQRANAARNVAAGSEFGTPFNFYCEMRDGSGEAGFDNDIQTKLFDFFTHTKMICNSSWRVWAANAESGQEVAQAAYPFRFSPTKLQNYIREWSDEYIKLVEAEKLTLEEEENAIKRELFNSIEADDIKMNLYKNIKSIYDKWVPGSKCELELCGAQVTNRTDDEDCPSLIDTFRFIDRAYNDIGDALLVNPIAMVVEMIEDYNIGMYDYLARTLADNNMDFIPLPTFINYHNEEAVQAAFKPEPFNIMETASGPQFVCMYIGERSKNLNLGTQSKHKDDGFQLCSGEAALPDDFVSGSTIIPAFRVAYGDSNQSMFKNFKLDQQEFTETDESLQIIDEIASKGGPNNPSAAGQNLFNVWRTRAYSAQIESLGNAQIQPFMYFQLDSVPMFAGAYTVIHVKHSIKPNHMSTSFKGVRVRATKTPMISKSTIFMNLIGSLSEVEYEGVDLGEATDDDRKTGGKGVQRAGRTPNSKLKYTGGGVKTQLGSPAYGGCIAYPVGGTQGNAVGIKVQSESKLKNGSIVNYTIPEIGKFMEDIGKKWYAENKGKQRGDTLYFNDFTAKGGGPKGGHHTKGTQADIRQVRNDKKNKSVYIYKAGDMKTVGDKTVPSAGAQLHPNYDREGTKELIEMILDESIKNPAWQQQPMFNAIWFNDPVLQDYFKNDYKNRAYFAVGNTGNRGIVRAWEGHHHHFHLNFNLPDRIFNDASNNYLVCKEAGPADGTTGGVKGQITDDPISKSLKASYKNNRLDHLGQV